MRTGQRGVAVVLAMGVVALATIAATGILLLQSIWARQSELLNERAQAAAMVDAGVDWVRAVLSDDRARSSVDHLGEPWALWMPPMPVERGELTGNIEDQQGLFNLNNLVQDGKANMEQVATFKRLLALLDLPGTLASALIDWMDADSAVESEDGAEDEFYLALSLPYLAANRSLTDVAELARVRGYDGATRTRLRPFVTALPGMTTINVNTARPEVLAAVVKGLDMASARQIVAQRERTYFRDQADFVNRLPEGATVENSAIDVHSDYFQTTLRVAIGEAQAECTALLGRTEAGWPAVAWRKYR